ncbi:helix-turn-helix domain-containing protein [Synechococcus sp. Nb3U1]|uniref:helix-turn-helix domain-containing protein n=1 Tax=Synechococcus sp. Nb3U1 TaxID=1914529 RepID=UPI001F35DBBD|nr:helix-turn-helix domain-containing protein [Synechococcus sp. Nb3U1]MCF2971472.1 helix-turn-helix domain-containing protein [Synechococcus sp. Nb3U1]MCF2972666.1 helix-turn-helix domain-containing protein [Synechococcus sp. Nb3U1]
MSGVLKIDIAETAEELKAVLEQQQRSSQRRKVQVLWWLKTGQAKRVEQLAQLSGCHRTTVSRWLSQYRQSGLEGLVEVASRSGRPRAISGEVLASLERELQDPEGFSSYGAVQQWLAAVHGQRVPYKTVHKTVRYRLKAKLKVPRPVSKKQTPGACESFKQTLQPRSASRFRQP